ncbi:MAG: hypothetical protein IJ054_08160, partial [Lachnospiraceae bacterium]|nr:hypothetical protein [Lachnospiraceae bacterium]
LYQNQQMQYGQSGYNPVQPYEKSPIGFIIFCIIMVALTVTEFLLFIKPGFLTEKRHDKLIEEANLTTEATTEITTTEVATTEITSTEETTEATTTEAPTTEATTTEAPTTEATTTEANLNTTELPVNTDFSLYTSNWHYNGLPSDARKITDYSQINGDWKMMYWWDPDHVFDSYAEELGNASLVFDGSVLSLTYKYGYIQWENSESYDESYIEPTTYTGSENADGFEIYNSYGFSIYGLEFYTINGSQYGFGSTISQSGEVATVLLVRP